MDDMFIDRDEKLKQAESPANNSDGSAASAMRRKATTFSRSMTGVRYKRKNDVQWNTCKSIMINLQAKLPSKWLIGCLRPNSRQKNVVKGYKKLRKEIGIVAILRNLRVLTTIAREGIKKAEW